MEDRLRVGVITSPHGIKGEVKVYPTTDDLNRFKDLKGCYLVSGQEIIETECLSCKFLKNMVVLKLKDYDDISQVEKFRQWDIMVNRKDAVKLEEGEFFICDVMGAAVYDQNDRLLGHIEEVLETAANLVFVIKDEKKKEILVPVVKDWIRDIDTEQKIVKVFLYNIMEDA